MYYPRWIKDIKLIEDNLANIIMLYMLTLLFNSREKYQISSCQLIVRTGCTGAVCNISNHVNIKCWAENLTEAELAKAMVTACSLILCSFTSSFLWASLCLSKATRSFSCSLISLISVSFSHNWNLLTDEHSKHQHKWKEYTHRKCT